MSDYWIRQAISRMREGGDAEGAACAERELAEAKAQREADFEVYHQVYMVLLNAGTDPYLGALEQAQALVARLAEARGLLRSVASVGYEENGTLFADIDAFLAAKDKDAT